MDIKLEIDADLWSDIKKNYENENYSGSILDAMSTLTDIIRNKSGLEGDGRSLVGSAFGGNSPIIQLNKLQTDSERDFQSGIFDIIKGLYAAIRNPRSHEKTSVISDIKVDTDVIIVFIDYIIKIINKSKTSFEEESFLRRVFDRYFVKSNEYANLLVNEIPKRQRCNISIKVVLSRSNGIIENLSLFMSVLIAKMDDIELSRFFKVISDELKYTSNINEI
ncbi:MAG: TIGR02391 family protein [Eubacteriales bacterium]